MTTAEDVELDEEDRSRRPSEGRRRLAPRGRGGLRQGLSIPRIIRRIWAFVHPYRGRIAISVGSVLVFTLTQLAIPLIIRFAIDNGMAKGARRQCADLVHRRLRRGHRHQLRRELSAGIGGRQGRRARAVRHAPRDDGAAAAGVARLHGQDRSRPADVAAAGRRQLDAGVPRDLGDVGRRHRAAVRHRHRAAVPRRAARAADARHHADAAGRCRLFWLPPAKRSFMAAHETNSIANGALAEGINGVRTVQSLNRQRVNFELYDEKAHTNLQDASDARPSSRR